MQGLAAIEHKRQLAEDMLVGLETGEYMMRIMSEYEAEICDMNAREQLFEKGMDATGASIAEYAPYAPLTIEYKVAKGQPVNRVTLRDTGDFHASFYLVIDPDKFTVWAGDEKTAKLVRQYGGEIFGLTPQNLDVLISEYVYPELRERAKKLLD